MIARVVSAFRRMPRGERAALIVAIALGALATIGQGIQFFDADYDAYAEGMVIVAIFSALAGAALAFEVDIFPSSLDAKENHAKAMALGSDMLQIVIICGVEFVLGEVLFLIGLASHAQGIDGDITVILAPLLVGVLVGGLCCLLGLLAGMLVAWPLVKLVQFMIGRRSHKPANPVSLPLAMLFLTVVVFAILGTLGANVPDVAGTPTGRGLYAIVYLYTHYTGTPTQQVLAWIARPLGAVLIVEVMWIRRAGHVHGMGDNMTVDKA